MSDTASSEMSRMHSLSVEQGKRISELEAENAKLENDQLVNNTTINTLRRQKAELEGALYQVEDVYRQAKSMGGGHSRETQALTEALGAALQEGE